MMTTVTQRERFGRSTILKGFVAVGTLIGLIAVTLLWPSPEMHHVNPTELQAGLRIADDPTLAGARDVGGAGTRFAYQEAEVAWTLRHTFVVGHLVDLPTPSVTHLAATGVYLVRSDAELVAVSGDGSLTWNPVENRFSSAGHGDRYDWRGECAEATCNRVLVRHPVFVHDGQVVVDVRAGPPDARLAAAFSPLSSPSGPIGPSLVPVPAGTGHPFDGWVALLLSIVVPPTVVAGIAVLLLRR